MQAVLGASPAIEALRANVDRLIGRARASSRFPPILIQGETGTGKGFLGSLLHHSGQRSGGPFVAVNCAAILVPTAQASQDDRGRFRAPALGIPPSTRA